MSEQIWDSEGFILLRRGLGKHIRRGKLPPNALAVYIHLLLCADFTTGVQHNSAIHIVFAMGNTICERHVRRALAHLEKGGYIKRFMKPGKRGDYPILIDKYEIRTHLGTEEGTEERIEIKRLNASTTSDWECPVYDYSAVDGSEDGSTSSRTLGRSLGRNRGRFVKNTSNNSGKNFGKNSGKEGFPSATNSLEPVGDTPTPPIDIAVADESVSSRPGLKPSMQSSVPPPNNDATISLEYLNSEDLDFTSEDNNE
jgi:hypothetical protein